MTVEEVQRIIMNSPAKSCDLDPIPTFLIRQHIDLLAPFITAIVNASLSQGRLPRCQKHAIVTPRPKKASLDLTDMTNFRPVSNLTFLSKVIERAVARQLHAHLQLNNLLPSHQSAYRPNHSTETAMLRVISDALTAADERRVTLLALLDMSAAFDCVDHRLLLRQLQKRFGLTGDVLLWMTSFLTDRTQQIHYNGSFSPTKPIRDGVPQGSVLGPVLFNMYTADLEDIVESHHLRFHQYADDCQVYVSVPTEEATTAATSLSFCVAAIDEWLKDYHLRLNPSKTLVLWLGSRQQIAKVSVKEVNILSSIVPIVDTARDLGVVLDSQLSMSAHVTAVCRSAYSFLRQLRSVIRGLPIDAAKTLIQAFVSSRLDYCNAILFGITDRLLRRLQSVQNAAARLITGSRRCDHITPILRDLHWLPVRRRIDFKVATMVFRALHDRSPQYLASDCRPVTNNRQLRSSTAPVCVVRRTRTHLGDRSFEAAGPRLWNKLPAHLRNSDLTIQKFRRALKTFLFD